MKQEILRKYKESNKTNIKCLIIEYNALKYY